MSKPTILLQLDTNAQASVFDSVVAVDAGVDQLLRHAQVVPETLRELVYGTIFTRGPKDLHRTAIFVGGEDVAAGERVLTAVQECFLGPLRVSVMLDSNGANTTAAAAVLAALQHLPLAETTAVVLAATGPVGHRVTRLLAREGATVRAASRRLDRAEQVVTSIRQVVPDANLTPVQTDTPAAQASALEGAQLVISAGAAGVQLLSERERLALAELRVAIDLSAVPPTGLEGVEPQDRGETRQGVVCFGALGVGATKMKIHKVAIQRLFKTNDQVLDAEEIFELGRELAAASPQ